MKVVSLDSLNSVSSEKRKKKKKDRQKERKRKKKEKRKERKRRREGGREKILKINLISSSTSISLDAVAFKRLPVQIISS